MTRHENTATGPDDPAYQNSVDEWNAAHVTPIVPVAGTTHTTAAADAGKQLRCTSASPTVVTVDNLSPGKSVEVLQAGAGAVSVVAGGTFTVVSRGSVFGMAGQWSLAAIFCDATDHAVWAGDIA